VCVCVCAVVGITMNAIIIIIIIIIGVGGRNFTPLKVPRPCPLVLLVTVGLIRYKRHKRFKWLDSSSGARPSPCRGFYITDTSHSAGLLWTSDWAVAETST
jgi:hypothetical protein